jgi:signal transduction histidine kinase
LEKNIKNTKIIGVNDRLIELFAILIDNAIKYSKNGQTIKINSDTEKGRAQIQIIDQGIGISEKDLPHIFDRFYRSDKSRNEKGYGLGLSIAKKITELHNGSISVESKLGEGSKFIVNFPLKG